MINHFNQHPWSRCLRWPVLGSGQLTCVMCDVFTPWPTRPCGETYQVFIHKRGTLCFEHNTISFCRSQSACPRSVRCIAMRGEVRRDEVADLLAPMIQTLVLQQQLMAASLGLGHPQAVARAGRNVENFYWMK